MAGWAQGCVNASRAPCSRFGERFDLPRYWFSVRRLASQDADFDSATYDGANIVRCKTTHGARPVIQPIKTHPESGYTFAGAGVHPP